MNYERCQAGNLGYPGNFDLRDWLGLNSTLVFWVVLIAGLILIVLWAKRGVRSRAAFGPFGSGPSSAGGQNHMVSRHTAREIFQAQIARGQITSEQHEVKKQDGLSTKASESLEGESK
jgi:hypothetical protein